MVVGNVLNAGDWRRFFVLLIETPSRLCVAFRQGNLSLKCAGFVAQVQQVDVVPAT